eukprot:jgi/Mesvir1/17178/Mv07599-RA.1
MEFSEAEAQDGLRFSWNVWPSSRIEAARIVVPLGCMVTPLKEIPDMPVLPYEPVYCKTCRAVLNPYARVDYVGKIWICPFCYQRNHFPPHYADISETSLPAELFPNFTTVEYTLPSQGLASPPVLLFVVDTCQPLDEFQHLKDSLQHALALLPETTLVGLISYGTHVNVHELGFSHCPKTFLFRGDQEVTAEQVQEYLSLGVIQAPRQPRPGGPGAARAHGLAASAGIGRFLLPLSECDFVLQTALEEMQPNPYPVPDGTRPLRATGAAVAVAVGMMEACCPGVGGRVMLFVSGPTTVGPGLVVGPDLAEPIRTHQDFEKEAATHFKKSAKMFKRLTDRMVTHGHCMDVFACSLDQVGLAECKQVVEKTGGAMVLADTFTSPIFKQSLVTLFQVEDSPPGSAAAAAGRTSYLRMPFNATVDVLCSAELKINGAIGPCSSLEKKTSFVADSEIGLGQTSAWKMGTMTNSTTLAMYFEVVNTHSNPIPSGQPFFIQFQTSYQHGDGTHRLRVLTAARTWADGSAPGDIASGFDQEAAAVIMARMATHKAEHEDSFDVLRWLDRMLIRLASKFGEYVKDDPASFRLTSSFSFFPQFMFHLRRSQFLQVFNSTPDETAFYRIMLNREPVLGSLVMIQPTLLAYSFDGPPVPVLLDVSSMAPDRILLLDTFFSVVIHHGSTIAQWRKLGYQNDPEHENFRALLEAPKADATELMSKRFPMPKLVECDQHGSQARFLLAKLNPSLTHNSDQFGSGQEVIFTDDVSLQVFMEHLQRLAVQQ